MKITADKNITKRELAIGDMVYLKVQPYRHTSLSIHMCIKLQSKYYWSFIVLEKGSQNAYKLLLPEGCKIHPTFHVSQIKKHHGPPAVPESTLPLVDALGNIQTGHAAVLDRKSVPRKQGDITLPVVQWLMQWINLPK